MNKKVVNDWIEPAINALRYTGIANENNKILKTCRSQISTFGTAVVMGSLKSAVAFFSRKSKSDVERPALLRSMYYVIMGMSSKEERERVSELKIFKWICENDTSETKEKFINASIALKLAMNFYDLSDDPGKKEQRGEDS